jgi:hypothetical protein
VDRWCAARETARGAVLTLEQTWELSKRWYGSRLSPDFRRPTVDEAHEMFASVGLTGDFWRLAD